MKKQLICVIALLKLLFAVNASAQVFEKVSISEQHNEIAAGVIEEINLVRSNPAAYAENLEAIKGHYTGSVYLSPTGGRIVTFEGVAAVDEAIRALRTARTARPLNFSEGMSRAAMDHVFDLGLKGVTSHTGTDGSVPGLRLNRYGAWQNDVGENINFGRITPREIVISMLIDDGVKSRGHRKNILQTKFAFIGTASGRHSRHDIMTVVVFADDYFDFFRPTRKVSGRHGVAVTSVSTVEKADK